MWGERGGEDGHLGDLIWVIPFGYLLSPGKGSRGPCCLPAQLWLFHVDLGKFWLPSHSTTGCGIPCWAGQRREKRKSLGLSLVSFISGDFTPGRTRAWNLSIHDLPLSCPFQAQAEAHSEVEKVQHCPRLN